MSRETAQSPIRFNIREAYMLLVAYQQGMWDLEDLFHVMRHGYGQWDVLALDVFLDCIGGVIMARGSGSKAKAADKQWTRFVAISMEGVRLEDVLNEYRDGALASSAISGLLSSGYRMGVSYNEGNSAFVVSITCRDDSSPNTGCTFSSFAGDWWTAILISLYKHYVIAQGIWEAQEGENRPTPFG